MDNGASSYHRFLMGDKSGFNEIVEMFGDSLVFFINGFVKNPAVAEDLMEDTFLELIIHKRKFREDALFKTYLFKIARNKALNYIKKHSRFSSEPIEALADEKNDIQAFEEDFLKDMRKKKLHSVLKDMNDRYCEVLHLIYFEEMTYESAAAVLKVNKKQIDNLAYRAKKQLKIALEKEGFNYEEY